MKVLEGMKSCLKKIAESYERNPHGPEIVFSKPSTKIAHSGEKPSFLHVEEFLTPPVIVWDPLLQCSEIFPNGLCCPHESHASQPSLLFPRKWKDGHSDKQLPRKLYGEDCVVLLMSRVYVCRDWHEIAAHDPAVLEHLSAVNYKIPFALSHRSGVTIQLLNLISSLACVGLTFAEIERHLAQKYYDCYWANEAKLYENYYPVVTEGEGEGNSAARGMSKGAFPDPKEWIELPSDDVIISCFILNFRESELFYTQRMSEISALYISADHTFKVAANIGIFLENQKWVTQYDSLFCVLNEKGQVVAWQLTKGTSFDHVQILLKNLKTRLDKQGVTLKAVYVDNCCQVRQKVQNIFGNEVPVKLDLFHAISRVTQKIPKQSRHVLATSCIADFADVFRYADDKEKERKKDTPNSEEMLENLRCFVLKWKDMKHPGDEDVLSASTIHEINCLRKHIEKGCLSGIPPGCGSEKNENLHKNLRHIVARSRLGVESALALFTNFFYIWNERKNEDFPKGVVKPISSYTVKLKQSSFQATSEVFGLICKANLPTEVKNNYSQFFSAKSNAFELHSQLANPEACVSQTTEMHDVLTRGLNFLLVDKQLKEMCDARSYNPRLIHLMSCSLSLFSNEQYSATTALEGRKSLDQVLLQYGLQLCQQPEGCQRGDSFFFALHSGLTSLLSQLKDTDEYGELANHLSSLGISTKPEHVKEDIKCLRIKLGDELLDNAAVYQKLLVSSDINFTEEVEKLKGGGYFRGEMGNLLALGATKVTRLSTVIFTSLKYIPVVPVVPKDVTLSSKCILMGFDVGSGTFYFVQPMTSEPVTNSNLAEPGPSGSTSDEKAKGCNCGRGRAKSEVDRKFCKQVVGGLPSRCVCYVNMKGCSIKCRCVYCDNPYGNSENAKACYTLTRTKRQPTKLKGQKDQTDAEFLLSKNVTPLLGWSNLENMMFDCLIDHMNSKDIHLDASNCLQQYDELCQIAKEEGVTCLGPKNIKQVQGKLLHVFKCAAVYEAMFKKQIEANWFL